MGTQHCHDASGVNIDATTHHVGTYVREAEPWKHGSIRQDMLIAVEVRRLGLLQRRGGPLLARAPEPEVGQHLTHERPAVVYTRGSHKTDTNNKLGTFTEYLA